MSEFSMFYNLFGCMHACILHVLSVCLTRDRRVFRFVFFFAFREPVKRNVDMKSVCLIQSLLHENVSLTLLFLRNSIKPFF